MKVEQYLKSIRKMSSRVIISLKHRPEGLQLNGAHIRTIDRIHAGDTLSVTMEDTPPDYLESEIRVPILYEDEDVLVYNKPADMPCHQAKTHQQDTLANVFARDCRERGLTLSYRCINRLDRNTSGAVVVAKNAHAATVLGGVGQGRHPGTQAVYSTAHRDPALRAGHDRCRYCPHRRGDHQPDGGQCRAAGPDRV